MQSPFFMWPFFLLVLTSSPYLLRRNLSVKASSHYLRSPSTGSLGPHDTPRGPRAHGPRPHPRPRLVPPEHSHPTLVPRSVLTHVLDHRPRSTHWPPSPSPPPSPGRISLLNGPTLYPVPKVQSLHRVGPEREGGKTGEPQVRQISEYRTGSRITGNRYPKDWIQWENFSTTAKIVYC